MAFPASSASHVISAVAELLVYAVAQFPHFNCRVQTLSSECIITRVCSSGNALGHVYLSVCVCSVRGVTFENFDL